MKQTTHWIGVIAIGILVGVGMQFASAWTEPTSSPPNGNVAGPVTTSSETQYKSGGLGIGGVLSVWGDITGYSNIQADSIQSNGNITASGNISGNSLTSSSSVTGSTVRGNSSVESGGDITAGNTVSGQRVTGSNELCIGSDCRTSWPEASSGGIATGSVVGGCDNTCGSSTASCWGSASTNFFNRDGKCDAGTKRITGQRVCGSSPQSNCTASSDTWCATTENPWDPISDFYTFTTKDIFLCIE